MKFLIQILRNRLFLWLLLGINVLGTIYGYIWYGWQLAETPVQFLVFVPDSPTASLFFVFVLVAFLFNKNWPFLEALAIVTLFKYGLWAVIMNILVYGVTGNIHWSSYLLIFSHAGMAIQGLLYVPFYKIKIFHLVVAALWILHNDVIDYVFNMMPRYSVLDLYLSEIGYFSFWLSIFSIILTYKLCVKEKHFKL
ncbi:DUF1405 domain-containing protein (plasmid) [Metabacillus halosaccharovorans]|uniref:DUF1405 domain-containing protein n=1 Tax=Metabacillus halosaccharovorans TaxID=930124 RepID=UPI001C1FF1B9|nr:DUF1405 domain-containing protein [Metabacillus halosaccharovorans]MBU7595795.1 DUF1405 domain-containing protein [Metabacillus halosaccharovorans]MCM3441495.1 DUF1405 domain-containing protein [Metabacillus halosaccharovorans]